MAKNCDDIYNLLQEMDESIQHIESMLEELVENNDDEESEEN